MRPSKKDPPSVIMFGRPGSGKGTQADLLAKKFGLEHFSSGAALRQRQKVGDFTAKKLIKVMNAGKWVPENTINKLVMDKMEHFKRKRGFKGWIYDGGPRLDLETRLLDITLTWYEWQKNVKVLLIDIPEKVVIQRLTKRRQCQKCGTPIPFLEKFKEMKECYKCGGRLVHRSDDTLKAIRERLAQFNKHTIPQMNYFKKQGRFIKVNGNQPIEIVFKDLLKALKW